IVLSASGGNSYTWQPSTDLSSPNGATTTINNPQATTIYTVTILSQSLNQQCIFNQTVLAVVHPTPTADFSYSIHPCGGYVNFTNLSTPSNASTQWTLNSNQTTTVTNPWHFYPNGGNYSITLLVTNSFGCSHQTVQTISVPAPPPVSVSPATVICAGKNQAQLQASGGSYYLWYPPVGLSSATVSNPVANPSVSTNYSVDITVIQGSQTCVFTLTTSVLVDVLSSTTPSAIAQPPVIVGGDASTLIYLGDPGATVYWYPSQFVTPNSGYTVSASPPVTTEFSVVLTKGVCTQTIKVLVEVLPKGCEEGASFVPNTFSPNGDGINDVLYVRGIKMESIYFAVYNRWGEKVFETYDKSKGWDGNYKGRPADNGVFGWYLKVKCYDGQEHFKKGNVTLVR
ncbi:MAG: gliding motility-associated C-terminal domain-containing protein, partial [Bacteroidia bacterium]|nr:gliding motility-associated C-terminal domain-containing protein [Bacteroidia bacterium]